ncbi:protein of unknown function [Paenibacillus alvei]|uniref:Uncharacterized protein n=1 Tax=Paenibacillus alvei TaxID=44250 RepID=A0A383RCA2_PAEAL|nr:protein of unknown function [Paenibacillus alvei]
MSNKSHSLDLSQFLQLTNKVKIMGWKYDEESTILCHEVQIFSSQGIQI